MLLIPNGIPSTAGLGIGAGDRDIDGTAVDPGGEPAQGDLDCRTVVGVGQQPVGQGVRAPVGRPGAAHSDVGQSRPAQVLHQGQRPGPQDLQGDHVVPAARNCTHMPGVSSAGWGRLDVPQHRRRCARSAAIRRVTHAGRCR